MIARNVIIYPVVLFIIVFLNFNLNAQTIYNRNGALLSTTKDSHKSEVAYSNYVGLEFCEKEHFSIITGIGLMQIGEYFRPTPLNSVNTHIKYFNISSLVNYRLNIRNHKLYSGIGPSLGYRYKSWLDCSDSKIDQTIGNQDFLTMKRTLFFNWEIGYRYTLNRLSIGAVGSYQLNLTKIIPKSYDGFISHGIGFFLEIGFRLKSN